MTSTTVRVGLEQRAPDGAVRVSIEFVEQGAKYDLDRQGARQLRDSLNTILGMIERGDDQVLGTN